MSKIHPFLPWWRLLPVALVSASLFLLPGCSKRRPAAPTPEVGAKPEKGGKPVHDELREAFDAFEAGQPARTVELLLALEAGGNQRPELYSLLGLAHIQLGQLELAETVLARGRQHSPGDPELAVTTGQLFLLKGRKLLDQGNHDGALASFGKLVEVVPAGSPLRSEVEGLYLQASLQALRGEDFLRFERLQRDHRALGLAGADMDVLRYVAWRNQGREGPAQEVLLRLDPSKVTSEEARELWKEFGPGQTGQPSTREPTSLRCDGLLEDGQAVRALRCYEQLLTSARMGERERDHLLAGAVRAALDLKSHTKALELSRARLQLGVDPVQARLDEADVRVSEGDVEAARQLLEQEVLTAPTDPRVRLQLAKLLARSGEIEGAEGHLLQLLEGYPLEKEQEARVYEMLGIVCARRKDLACAESWWLRLVGVVPDHCKAHYNLGTLYGQKGRYRESVGFLEKAIDCAGGRDPEQPKYLFGLALAYRQNGQNGEMCRALEKIVTLTPYKDPYHKRALEMRRNSGFCQVEEGVEGLPGNPDHPLRQGFARLEGGNLRGAREAFELHLLQRQGSALEDSLANLGLGRTFRREEQPARAVVAFERALKLREDPRIRVEFAESLFEIELYERSLQAWRKLRRVKGMEPARLRYEEARCLDRLGRQEEAMEAYEEAISLDPSSLFAGSARSRVEELVPGILDPLANPGTPAPAGSGRGLSLLAEAYLAMGNPEEAQKLFQEVTETGSGSPDAMVAYGRFRLDAGDLEGAEAAFRRALEVHPQHGPANLELARMVLASEDGLQEGFRLLMRARDAGGEEGFRATARMVKLYRTVGQQEDARFLLQELEAAEAAPIDLRDWARSELGRNQGASVGAAPVAGIQAVEGG